MADENTGSQEESKARGLIEAQDGYVVDASNFLLPTMGDYYLGAVDDVYLRRINAIVEGKDPKVTDMDDAKKAAYYTETPPFGDKLGNYNGVNYMKATNLKITDDDIALGVVDGDTLKLNINDIEGDSAHVAMQSLKKLINYSDNDTVKDFYINLIGIKAPRLAKWAVETESGPTITKVTRKVAQVDGDPKYVYAKDKRMPDDVIDFCLLGDSIYHEYTFTQDGKLKWCLDGGEGSEENAIKIATKMQDLLDKAGNQAYIMIDNSTPSAIDAQNFTTTVKDSDNMLFYLLGFMYGDSAFAQQFGYGVDELQNWAAGSLKDLLGVDFMTKHNPNTNTCGYFRTYVEPKKTVTGTVYIQIDGQWVNLVKAALCEENDEVTFSTEYAGANPDIFKPTSYDPDQSKYVDSFFDKAMQLDDRRKIQEEIFGIPFEDLRKWTVTIGDITLFVPPTNITVISTVNNQSMPLLRSKGSMSKSGYHTSRMISMDIYFNNRRGINGFSYETTAPNGTKFYYNMNCLRGLISHFKFVPFLPIDNEYINQTLGIDAVTVSSLSISSVENFPRTIKATLVCKEFDFTTYIPEIVDPNAPEDKYVNFFALAFNWEVMRYYYQRPLIRGGALASKKLDFNSDEFNNELAENRTTLMPMKFLDPTVTFYIADESYLTEMLARYRDMIKEQKTNSKFTEDNQKDLEYLNNINTAIKNAAADPRFQQAINKLSLDAQHHKPDESDIDLGNKFPEYNQKHSDDKGNYGPELNSDANADLNTAIWVLDEYIQQVNEQAGKEVVGVSRRCHYSAKNGDGTYKTSYGLAITIKLDETRMKDTANKVANFLGVPVESVYQNQTIVVPITGTLQKRESEKTQDRNAFEDAANTLTGGDWFEFVGNFELDYNDPSMMLLTFAEKEGDHVLDTDYSSSSYQNNDLKFVKYDTGTVRIKSYTASLTNHISEVYLKDVDGSAPQYLGGEDTMLSLVIETTDEQAIRTLSMLPSLASMYIRKYHAILPAYPIKIDSEITRFLGVYEVMVENVQTTVVSDTQPVHTIIMDLRSVDRTYRSKEALQKIDADNAGRKYTDQFFEQQLNGYFEMNKKIAKTEIYPDLELPTIAEMDKLGYDFIRYKFQDDRIYVDPDFYYMYPNVLSSQIIREAAINPDENVDMDFSDASGAQMTVKPAKNVGYEVTDQNDVTQQQRQKYKEQQQANYKQNSKTLNENLKDKRKKASDEKVGGMQDTWTICKDIKATFLEAKYKKELDAFNVNVSNAGIDPKNLVEGKDANGNPIPAQNQTAFSEGKWVYSSLQKAQEASTAIDNYLKLNYINENIGDKLYKDIVSGQKAEEEQTVKDTINNAATNAALVGGVFSYNAAVLSVLAGLTTPEDTAKNVEKMIKDTVDKFLSDDPIIDIFNKLNINASNQEFKDVVKDIIYAAACGLTGEKEYSNKKESLLWKPDITFVGTKEKTGSQDNTGKDTVSTLDDAIQNATEFGIFKIKQYNKETYAALTGEEIIDPWGDGSTVNTSHYLIDPYYRYNTVDVIEGYKRGCLTNPAYCAAAYFRICLYWLKRLIDMHAVPSIKADVLRDSAAKELDIEATQQQKVQQATGGQTNATSTPKIATTNQTTATAEQQKQATAEGTEQTQKGAEAQQQAESAVDANGNPNDIDPQAKEKLEEMQNSLNPATRALGYVAGSLAEHISFFSRNNYAIDSGKIWTASILASTDGSNDVLKRIDSRDYKGLNGLVQGCSKPESSVSPTDPTGLTIRKTTLALIGLGRITDFNAIGVKQSDPAIAYKRKIMEQIYLEAADDPSIFIPHSCHDMVVNDARGRMLRAFPTFYMTFIDEGRDIGVWKLHDNFYSIMSLMDLQIVKSRKLPADTAMITLSNFYQSSDTFGGDSDNVQQASWDEVWDSIFSPEKEAQAQEEQRYKQKGTTSGLKAGVRVHIRLGYGANASMLPIVFNGVIAEINNQETIDIVAQGDGIELMNPILDDDEARSIPSKDDFWPGHWNNRESPKTIMNAILTTHGGFTNNHLKDGIFGGFMAGMINSNPYGIYHFGDPDYKEILSSGEPTQNIFEACSKPAWGNSGNDISAQYATDDVPCINFELMNKTVWDVANVCKSVTPDFICAVAPFNFRSTLFIGAPRYYYAYDYYMEGQTVMEKRKPFQQYHLYTSSMDIIGNGISASSQNIRTVALGLYQVAETFNVKSQQRVGPIYADADIYPENQKTMVVDTQLYGKGAPVIGFITNSVTNSLLDDYMPLGEDHEKIAWRMTASALKDSMKDMYQGDLVILGDPSVKPHDRMFIDDQFSGMSGQCLVKEVTHSFNIQSGFTSTVSPDLIGVVDDKFEIAIQERLHVMSLLACRAVGALAQAALYKKIGPALSTKLLDKFGKYPEAISKALKNPNVQKAGSMAAKAASMIKGGTTALKGAGMVASGSRILGSLVTRALCAVPIGWAITIAGTYLIHTIERYLKNQQAMQIFPLKVWGIPYTAGVQGSQGFVYGSPSYYKQGGITHAFDMLVTGGGSYWGKFISGLIFSPETQAIAENNEHQLGLTNSDGSPIKNEAQFNGFLKSTCASQGQIPKDYREMQIKQLASTPEEMQTAYEYFSILNTNKFENDPKFKNMTLISEDSRLQKYMDEDDPFFMILHEAPELNRDVEKANGRIETKTININGKDKYVKAIKYETKAGTVIYDMPLLHKDAIDILYELVRRNKDKMPASNASDEYENFDYNRKSFIVVKSALRVGDTDTMASTGFSFVLEPRGNTKDLMNTVLDEFIKELEGDAQSNSLYNKVLFQYKAYDDTGEIAFTVKMPAKVTTQEKSAQDINKEQSGDSSGSITTEEEAESTSSSSSAVENQNTSADKNTDADDNQVTE